MALITIVGSGMMGSALAFPARENGNEVRLVGTHLDREIIENARKTNRHLKFHRDFPDGVQFYQIEELEQALAGARSGHRRRKQLRCGMVWRLRAAPHCRGYAAADRHKGLMDMPDGRLLTYPDLWQQKLDELGKHLPLCAVGGPCTSYELVAHDQTEVAFCGRDMQALELARSLMHTDYYHISLSTDVVGIESARGA